MNDKTTTPTTQKTQPPAPMSFFDWSPFDALRRQIDRVFEDMPMGASLGDGERAETRAMGWPGAPAVDYVETDADYRISAELPGMDEKSVELKYANGMLTISGEKTDEKQEKREGYYYSERRFGSFKRAFRVPDNVDADKIEASFEKGVLRIVMPKAPHHEAKEKKIEIAAK